MIRALAFLAIFGAISGTAGCAGADVHFTPPPPGDDENRLGPGDLFGVRVFGETELSQDYRVSSDGSIEFPYIGRMRVATLTAPQIEDAIRNELLSRNILRNPQVSVIIREFNSRRINVLGQVQHPGTFAFEQNMNIVQAVSLAGGFTPLANQRSVRLTRRVRGGGQNGYDIPVDLITQGRIANINLAPGDVIFVPERAF